MGDSEKGKVKREKLIVEDGFFLFTIHFKKEVL